MQRHATNFASILSLLGAFLATAVVLGLLGAGLVMPAVAATGAAARSGVSLFDSLPSQFDSTPLSQQSRILAADGSLIATPYDENRVIVPLSKVAPIMAEAQVAIEDSRFYQHGGVDPHGLSRAVVSNLFNSGTQGASTLTQQYVKLMLQENALQQGDKRAAAAAVARSGVAGYTRKLQELKYAVTLEKQLSKPQILESYLNIVYYGDRAYGVEAASRHYFGIHASQLSLPQAALLAGLVQQPSLTDPVTNPKAAVERRNVVLDRMHQLAIISDASWKAARATKLTLHVTPAQSSCAASPYPYFCTYVMAWLRQQPALGKTTAERIDKINRGGLTVQTTLDPKIQKAARAQLVKKVPVGNSEHIGAAAAVVEPGTGKVLAATQNTIYANKDSNGKTAVNWAVDQRYGASGGFAFGSTAKMFAVATALSSGMPIDTKIYAKPADAHHAAIFYPSEFSGRCKITQPWKVRNDEGTYNGQVSLTTATAKSVNTAFAGLVAKLGVCTVRDMMTKMGLHRADGQPIQPYPSPVTLGSDSVSPLTLASAYATVASGGKYCPPSPVSSITTRDKKPVTLPDNGCTQVLQPDVAYGTTQILTHVIKEGTGTAAKLADKRPAAGKTGTSDGSNETWFAGFTPQLATAVWVGTPNDPGNARVLRNLDLAGKHYTGQIFGATIAAPVWKQIMDAASKGMPIQEFAQASDKVKHGDRVDVPSVTGMPFDEAKAALSDAGLTAVIGGSVHSDYAAGSVASTSPGAGSKVLLGSVVSLEVSAGPSPAPPAVPQQPSAPTPTPAPSPTSTSTPAPPRTSPPPTSAPKKSPKPTSKKTTSPKKPTDHKKPTPKKTPPKKK